MNKQLEGLVNTLVSIPKGLRITLANLLRTKTTQRYPEVMPTPMGQRQTPHDPNDAFDVPYEIAPRYRGLHGLTRDPETGDLNCIGCMACAKVCPDDLISMDLEKREGHNGRFPVTFTVNIGPCCFCGLCAEVCPTPMRAIVMTDLFEWASYARDGRNLVLNQDDLVRNGDYEVARRAAGRKWGADGELLEVLPEEEGNPYFQFAPESGKADRMDKAKAKRADGETERPAKEAPATAAEPAGAADPLEAVRAAFAAVGLEPPADVAAFDLDSLDAVEDRKLRGQCKSAVMKARKALEAGEAPVTAAVVEAASAPAEAAAPAGDDVDALRAALVAALSAAGVAAPEAPESMSLESLDAVEDRKLRGQCKSALRKLQRALGDDE